MAANPLPTIVEVAMTGSEVEWEIPDNAWYIEFHNTGAAAMEIRVATGTTEYWAAAAGERLRPWVDLNLSGTLFLTGTAAQKMRLLVFTGTGR